MSKDLLTVQDLSMRVGGKNILKSLNLPVKSDEIHVLMGPNGAGKSTLGNTLVGSPRYEMIGGSIEFQGQNLLDLPVNERAKASIFILLQNLLEVSGISLTNSIRNVIEQRTDKRTRLWGFRKEIAKVLETLNMDPSYVDHGLNVGFSNDEKKKAEILQLFMLKPNPTILDETDSDPDVGAVRTASRDVGEYQKGKDSVLIIITRNTGILSSLKADKARVLVKGSIVADSDGSLIEKINRDGFVKLENKEQACQKKEKKKGSTWEM